MNTPSPALITQRAVRRFPRFALIFICLLYVLAGLWGHDPWKRLDVTSFGYMWTLAQQKTDFFNIQMAGLSPDPDAYLPYWIGAWSIQWLGQVMPAELAVRVPFSLLSWASMAFIWYGIYYLSRNPQAQPVAFAFGGEAHPKDYARSLADAGLLAFIACLGLALPIHETTPMAMQLHGIAAVFAGASILPFFPTRGLLIAWSGLLIMTLSGAPSLALILGLGCVFLWSKHPQSKPPQIWGMLLGLLSMLLLIVEMDLWRWRILSSHELFNGWRDKGELLIWFLWPAWPLAAWTLWTWRAIWKSQVWSQHLTWPSFMLVVTLVASLLTRDPDRTLLLALPGMAALAAFSLPTLSRAVAALIDWFTLLFFTGGALIIWGVWVSLQTGVPAQPALNVAKLVPGFVHNFNILSFSVAVVVSLIWLRLIQWRVGRHPHAIWKSLVLPASGATLCWVLLMTLWLPILDRGLSYKTWSEMLTRQIKQPSCVYALNLDRSQIAGLGYHGQIEFRPLPEHAAPTQCTWLMTRPATLLESDQRLSDWQFLFKSTRPADKKDEVFVYTSTSRSSDD